LGEFVLFDMEEKETQREHIDDGGGGSGGRDRITALPLHYSQHLWQLAFLFLCPRSSL